MTSPPEDKKTAPPSAPPDAITSSNGASVSPADLSTAIEEARDYLLGEQHQDGHWRAELEGGSILESEYIFAKYFVGERPETHPKLRKAAECLRQQQLEDGAWGTFPGDSTDVSASAEAYFVLKLMGDDPEAPHMRRAREAIRERGGVKACNTYTQIYLAIFGQYSWDKVPAIPPEMILLPTWFPFSIYDMSSWTRGIVVPLSIIWALKPTVSVPERAHIDELYTDQPAPDPVNAPEEETERLWWEFFQTVDTTLKQAEQFPVNPLRSWALEEAEQWIVDHLEKSDGVGAIFPPIINTIIAFHALGYETDDPLLQSQIEELENLEIEEEDSMRLQPCLSPVWDTSQSLVTLLETDLPRDHDALQDAGTWLLDREVEEPGDWAIINPDAPLGGWYFEYNNEFYPDTDDTAEILFGLKQLRFEAEEMERERKAAIDRGLSWLLSMQNSDGGWAAFDKDCDNEVLTYVPFADHNAMIDPSHVDLTGRIVQMLSAYGYDQSDPAVRRAVEFLNDRQLADGTWFGRWGCNYIYGTWLALVGLKAAGVDLNQPRYQRAGQWIRQHQNDDGGWGETLASYEDPSLKGQGESTASQTAWALMALFALDETDSDAVRAGVHYLLRTQLESGAWTEEEWTGTGFPEVFYLKYHMYPVYFPILALAQYQERAQPISENGTS